jgi:CheY-like chemotaxis protein
MTALVLIVEDDEGYSTILEFMLRRKGYKTVSAPNVTKAMDALTTITPDLMVLDVMMPDGTGIDLCKHVRSQPATKYTPVIMFSGIVDPEIIRQSEQAGASSYLRKDQLPQLLQEVKTLLGMNLVKSSDA